MLFLLLAFSSYLHFIGSASAQVSAPICTYPDSTWVGSLFAGARFVSMTTRSLHRVGVFIQSFNSLEQGPCLVAAYLLAVCNNGSQYMHCAPFN